MSLDAEVSRLTKTGKLVMENGEVYLTGFDGENCTCRDVCVQALSWAIGELNKKMLAIIQEPGGDGSVGID